MNFEDAYKKLRDGTATDEEAAFVARELENVRRISSILDDPELSADNAHALHPNHPELSDPGIRQAEIEAVQKARKVFNHKTLIRTIIVVLCSLLVIAAIVCAILFIPSNISASGKVKLTKEQVIEAAHACLVEEVGEEEAGRFYVDYAHRHLRYVGSIFDAIYVYKVEYEDIYGREYEIEVNSNSGYTVIRDIDLG